MTSIGRQLKDFRPDATVVAVFVGYLAIAVVITWPWALHPGSQLYGVVGGDLTSSVGFYGVAADELKPPFFPGVLHSFNAPAGIENQWALNLAGVGSSSSLFVLSVLFGSVAAHGIMAVAGYALTAFAMFLLLRRLGAIDPAAAVGGLAFGFWPYAYGTGWTWPHYIQGWVFVLLIWRMIVLAKRPNPRNGVLAGIAAVVAMTWVQYYLVIGGVLLVVLALLAIGRAYLDGRVRQTLVALAVAFCPVVVAIGLILAAGVVADYEGLPSRETADVVQRSARPLMYVVPGPRSAIVDDQTRPFLERRYSGGAQGDPRVHYADIYVGISLLLLSLVGAAWAIASLARQRKEALRDPLVTAAILGAAVAVTGFLFSMPPTIEVFGITLPMPYTAIDEVTSVFRVTHRFAVFVMLGASILAACALTAVLRTRSTRVAWLVCAVVGAVLFVDLYAPAPEGSRVTTPRWTEVLADRPAGILAEYPLQSEAIALNIGALYQPMHHKQLFAGFRDNTEWASRKYDLGRLSQPGTVAELARFGVRYVVVHHPDELSPAETRPGQPIKGLRLIDARQPSESIYEVVARPSATAVRPLSGFDLPQGNRVIRRSQGLNPARLEVVGDCEPCVGVVRFRAGAHVVPRVVSITQDGYGVVFRQTIFRQRVVTVRVRPFSRRTVLRMTSDPAPDPLGITISEPSFEIRRAGR